MTWLLHRLDDRLIHGQVVIAWGQRLHPRRIVVADDATAADDWERELLSTAAPGIEVDVYTLAAAAADYAREATKPGGAFLLVRNLAAALALVELGAPVPSFTLGGLHYAPGKEKINEYVYLDDVDRQAARELLARGVRLDVQDVPASRPHPLAELDAALRSA